MQRNSLKIRKSLGRGQKENVPQILNNIEKEPSLSTLPSLHFPCATLNLRPDPSRKSKRLPLLDVQKSRTSRSTQHLSNTIKLLPMTSMAPSTKSSLKQLVSSTPSYQINELENINLAKDYGLNHLDILVSNDTPSQCLQNHNIKMTMRAKMVDWMVQVLSSYKCEDKTFFQSVELMDSYYQKTQKVQESKDLHLIGVCCMFMIIKLQEIIPLRLQTVYQKIGHKKLSTDVIKKKQQQILSSLQFNIIVPTLYDIIQTTLQLWFAQTKLTNKDLEQIFEYCIYMSKMVVIQYELVSVYPKKQLSGSIIFLAFKIYKQFNSQFDVEKELEQVLQILKLTKQNIKESSTKSLDLIKNFQNYYPSFGNIRKFSKIGSLGKKSSLF